MKQALAQSIGRLTHSILVPVACAAILLTAVAPARGQLTIVPTFDNTITSDPNAAQIEATIITATQQYATLFTTPITVDITYAEMSGGLGESNTGIVEVSYPSFRSALIAKKSSAADISAISNSVPNQANSPVDGNANMWLSVPNARALGLVGAPSGSDATISLNTSIINFNRSSVDPSKYDLQAVVQHETDEVLGLGSGLNLPTGFPRLSRPQDLTRYQGVGSLSFSTSTSATAYFSIDGGNTNLINFNQSGGGADYGDWASSATPHVQDAFGTPGSTPNLDVELTALDVIGYNLSPVPEPGTMALVGGGAILLAGYRRRRPRACTA